MAAFAEPGGGSESNVAEALAQAGKLVRRPGFVVLLSDLLTDPVPVADAARTLRARGHEVLVLHIMDPAERDFPEGGEALYRDPESRLEVPASPGDVRAGGLGTRRGPLRPRLHRRTVRPSAPPSGGRERARRDGVTPRAPCAPCAAVTAIDVPLVRTDW